MPDVSLTPTLVYDTGRAPFSVASQRVLAVRQALLNDGWTADSVTGWTIELNDLSARFTRLGTGDA
jgi:hypothetical protein